MIKSIYIDNFKSLVDFKLELAKFSCLVGLNGSGKSTVLQALDFLSRQMTGDLDGWLAERHWDKRDINSKFTNKKNINFTIKMEGDNYGLVTWSGSFNRDSLKCTHERIKGFNKFEISVVDGVCNTEQFVNTGPQEANWKTDSFPIRFKYQGSIVSQLKDSEMFEEIQAMKEAILGIKSLDLLSPDNLRANTRISSKNPHRVKVGLGGQRLAGYIHESGKAGKEALRNQLDKAYPDLKEIGTRNLHAGVKQLFVREQFNGKSLESNARHVNDGLLRLMAIFSQLHSGAEFLLFDEIENGINQELVEFMLDSFVESNSQVLVTTHSPVILNFLEDDIAKQGVIYLYKDKSGITKVNKMFDIPSLSKKLNTMGPGEAYSDTDLNELYREAQEMDQ